MKNKLEKNSPLIKGEDEMRQQSNQGDFNPTTIRITLTDEPDQADTMTMRTFIHGQLPDLDKFDAMIEAFEEKWINTKLAARLTLEQEHISRNQMKEVSNGH